MINRNQGRAHQPSFVPKYSDPDIIRSVLKSDIWKYIFLRDKKAFWLLFKALVFLKMEMFISPIKAVLRYGHGKRTTGIIITLMSTLMLIAFNTNNVVGYLATFFPFITPVLPFLMTGDHIISATFFAIRSEALLIFWMAYLVISSIHLLCIYKGIGTTQSLPTKRGTSILYMLLFKHFRLSENVVEHFLEPLLAVSIGYFLMSSGVDFTFGLFLIIAGSCLFIQESYDAVSSFVMSQ